jgi:hypothetical protein
VRDTISYTIARVPPLRTELGWAFTMTASSVSRLVETDDGPAGVHVEEGPGGIVMRYSEADARTLCAALGVPFPE